MKGRQRNSRSGGANGRTVLLRMEKMAQGGSAISHLEDGRVCFVSKALTGELAEVSIVNDKKDFARGVAVRILESSPFRVAPVCPFYGKCGGCSAEHASFEFQLQMYREVVEETFRRIAKVELPADWKIHSGSPYGYRNRARLVRSGGGWGFRGECSRLAVPVSECPVLTSALNRAISQGMFPKVPEISVFDGGEGKISFYHPGMSPSEVKRFASDTVQIAGMRISMDASCFFQSNLELLPRLVESVRESAGSGDFLVDLFSGVGFFAAVLQKDFRRIVTVERDSAALSHANRNVPGATNVSAPAEDWLSQNDASGADVLIVDPPRTGVPPSAIEAVAKASPKKLLYVSCDPATLARDTRLLSARGYCIRKAEGFAFYPQTPHFEMLVEFFRP